MAAVRDQAVRVQLGISIRRAAKLAGVSRLTLMLYESDPQAIRKPLKREACATLYRRLRTVLDQYDVVAAQ